MKHCALFRLPFGFAFALVMTAFVLAPLPATAQHGGGHAGGGAGHFGGGGGHIAGFGGSHSRSSSHPVPSHLSAKPAANSTPPLASAQLPVGSPVRTSELGLFSSAPTHTTIGFPPADQPTTFPTGLIHSDRSAGPLSFSGEGHQIWQNFATPSTTAATRFGAHLTTSPGPMVRPRPPLVRPPGLFAPYYPVTFFPAFGFYGFGPFLGFGWGCDPLDPWAFGCGGFGYGYGGYGPGYGYGFGGYYPPAWDYGQPPASDDTSNEPSPSTWQNPPSAEDSQSNVAVSIPGTLIYLQDGSSYEVTDYWFADDKLHYVTNYGGENSVSLGQIDMQRTVDANAARGVDFTLHPAPPPSLTPPPSADNVPAAKEQQ